MRQITTREKAFLSVGVLAAVAIFVWFILLPMLEGEESNPESTLEAMQERLGAVQKLASISPMLIDLEANVREQSGYKDMSFKRGSANPVIIKYIAQAANGADINELDQLDAKLDTSKKSKTETVNQKEILKSIVDQLYMAHILDEVKRAAEENNAESDPPPDLDTAEESSDTPEKPEISEESEDVEQTKPKIASPFPLIPKDIPYKVKELMAESIKERQGKTLELADTKGILEKAKIEDESEAKRVQNRLRDHSKIVRRKKDEMVKWLGDTGVSQTAIDSKRLKKYSIKMIFKSNMGQLVRFLYNLQDTAKWLRVDSIRIGISDRKQTTLSVQISMTATVLYGLAE